MREAALQTDRSHFRTHKELKQTLWNGTGEGKTFLKSYSSWEVMGWNLRNSQHNVVSKIKQMQDLKRQYFLDNKFYSTP